MKKNPPIKVYKKIYQQFSIKMLIVIKNIYKISEVEDSHWKIQKPTP